MGLYPLDTFAYEFPGNEIWIEFEMPEFTAICPFSDFPDFGTIRLNTDAYRGEIATAAAQFGVEEAIVRAIIHAESAYNPNAMSRVGAHSERALRSAAFDLRPSA